MSKLDVREIALTNLKQQVTFLCGQGVPLPTLTEIVTTTYKHTQGVNRANV